MTPAAIRLRLFSETERRQMLADIAAVALAIGRDVYPERTRGDLDIGDGTSSGDTFPCPHERLAFLRAWWPRIEAALRSLEAAPAPAVKTDTRRVRIERARRVSPLAVLEAVRAGDFIHAAPHSSPLSEKLGNRLPRRIRETIAAPTFDTPANRAVKTILAHWSRDIAAIAELGVVVGAAEAAREAARLRVRLRAVLRRPVWRDLPPLSASVPPLSAAHRAHCPYRLLHDAYRRYRRAFGFCWDNPVFSLPARETWLLYEYWTLFQTADALRSLGFRAVSADNFAVLRGGMTFTLAKGSASCLRFADSAGRRVAITYSRTFHPAGVSPRRRSAWVSRSHAMRPDVTLETEHGLLFLDAKYKAYSANETAFSDTDATEPGNLPLTDDINQLHAYRDGIRRVAGGDSSAVHGAWLLYAGRADGVNRPVLAYPAATPERPFGDGQIGGLLLRPGDKRGAENLRALIAAFLRTG